jgi:hypothetical protein
MSPYVENEFLSPKLGTIPFLKFTYYLASSKNWLISLVDGPHQSTCLNFF